MLRSFTLFLRGGRFQYLDRFVALSLADAGVLVFEYAEISEVGALHDIWNGNLVSVNKLACTCLLLTVFSVLALRVRFVSHSCITLAGWMFLVSANSKFQITNPP